MSDVLLTLGVLLCGLLAGGIVALVKDSLEI